MQLELDRSWVDGIVWTTTLIIGNGRIWILWDPRSVEYRVLSTSAQYVHGGLYRMDGTLVCWLTFVHAFNQLDLRKTSWIELQHHFVALIRARCIIAGYVLKPGGSNRFNRYSEA